MQLQPLFLQANGLCPDVALDLEGSADKPALLLLHGLTGGPSDFRTFVRPWVDAEWTVYAPVLPGHGGVPRDLIAAHSADYLNAALGVARALQQSHKSLVVGGLSQGALLAINVSADLGIPALVMAPPTHLGGLVEQFLHLLVRLGLDKHLAWSKEGNGGDISLRNEQFVSWSYDWMPVTAIATLRRLIVTTQDRLQDMRERPVWWAHGALDHTAPLAGSQSWFESIRDGSADQRWRLAPRSQHILTRDCESTELANEAFHFSLQHS